MNNLFFSKMGHNVKYSLILASVEILKAKFQNPGFLLVCSKSWMCSYFILSCAHHTHIAFIFVDNLMRETTYFLHLSSMILWYTCSIIQYESLSLSQMSVVFICTRP